MLRVRRESTHPHPRIQGPLHLQYKQTYGQTVSRKRTPRSGLPGLPTNPLLLCASISIHHSAVRSTVSAFCIARLLPTTNPRLHLQPHLVALDGSCLARAIGNRQEGTSWENCRGHPCPSATLLRDRHRRRSKASQAVFVCHCRSGFRWREPP